MAERRGAINKAGAAAVMAMGLATIFAPFVITDAPMKGRTERAPIDLPMSRADLWRPAPPPFHQHDILYGILFIYLLMIIGLVVLALPSPQQPSTVIALIGSAVSLGLLKHAARSFGWLFYGRVTHARISQGYSSLRGWFGWEGLQFELAFYLFLAVMPRLFLVVIRSRSVGDHTGTAGNPASRNSRSIDQSCT
jgi:hypothetical protein